MNKIISGDLIRSLLSSLALHDHRVLTLSLCALRFALLEEPVLLELPFKSPLV